MKERIKSELNIALSVLEKQGLDKHLGVKVCIGNAINWLDEMEVMEQ